MIQWLLLVSCMCYLDIYSCTQKFEQFKNFTTFFYQIELSVYEIFKASALWADAFYKSKCLSVCLCVWLSVCSLLRYCLTVSLPPLLKVGCQIFFRDSESLGKRNGKNWSNIWTFLFGNGIKSPRKKKFFLLILPYKTWWKPRFQMD